MTPERIWQATLGELELALQRPVFENWLKDARYVAFEDGKYIIAVKNTFAKEWLEQRLRGMIIRRLERLNGRSVDVAFIVRPETPADPEPARAGSPLLDTALEPTPTGRFQRTEFSTESNLQPYRSFDNFIVGEGNRFAYAACQAVAQNPGTSYNPLFLYGGVGLGKTHLLHAIGNAAAQEGYNVRYVTSETFTNELIEAIRTHTNVAFRQTYRNVDVLLIDDIQFLQGKESTQNEFFHTFNSLAAASKQIVIASDRPPHLLTRLEDRLVSRFGGGLTVDLTPPDLEHRIAILQAKAFEKTVIVPEEVLRYIAEHYNDNVRELQGAFNRVVAFAQLHGRPISLDLTKKILEPHQPKLDNSPDAILDAVAQEYNITISELKGSRRTRRISVPRQMAMYLLRDVAQLSFPQIGEYLGGRDHTTIMHGATKIEKSLRETPEVREKLERVRVRLKD
ncbi:MAG: chromosomal replication initiator protein DnaA [Clostridia bacterium]|nr:MAG: chromosomal replication initiator protein DnaA [Clostridia bacterium]